MNRFKYKFSQFWQKCKNAKRLPPILIPLWLIVFTVDLLLIRFPMWLVGFWICKNCGNRYWLNDNLHKLYARQVSKSPKSDDFKYVDKRINVCDNCKTEVEEKYQSHFMGV